jgi:hypothetical protein
LLYCYGSTNGNHVYASTSFRAPIFYDSSDTSYYLDPNDSSRLNGRLTVAGGHGDSSSRVMLNSAENGASTGISALQMWCSEPGNTWDWAGFGYNVDNSQNSNMPVYYFGRINPNFGQAYMRMGTGGQWYFYTATSGTGDYSGTRYTHIYLAPGNGVETYGILYNDTSVRGPIFYDSQNTTYYVDPNDTGTSVRVAGNVTAYYSDMRLKKHLGKIENAVDKIKKLEGFYYEANEIAQKLGYKPKREVGVSAQSVQEVLPEIVTDAPINSNYLTISYERLTPLLIEAVKEQQTQIEDQKTEISELKSMINMLVDKVNKLVD